MGRGVKQLAGGLLIIGLGLGVPVAATYLLALALVRYTFMAAWPGDAAWPVALMISAIGVMSGIYMAVLVITRRYKG